MSATDLAYRIVELALSLEQAQREQHDVRQAEVLVQLLEAARELRRALGHSA